MKRFIAAAIIRFVIRFANWGWPKLISWAAGEKVMAKSQEAAAEHAERFSRLGYTQPDGRINLYTISAAFDDCEREDPERMQSTLNALLEVTRSETVGTRWVQFMGSLVASGHDPQEAMFRMLANVLRVGMMLERRLGSTSDGAAVPEAASITDFSRLPSSERPKAVFHVD
jgi:hypothetical protein